MLKLNATFFLKTRARVPSLLLKCALSAFMLATLINCGGSSTPDESLPSSKTDLGFNNLITLGVFNDKEFISVLINSNDAASANANFYALQFNNIDPDIYSGTLSGVGTSAAISNNLGHQNTSGIIRTGIATLSASPDEGLKTKINFLATSTESAKELNWTPKIFPQSTYLIERPALISEIQGIWTGRLSYGLGFSDNYKMNITPSGELSALQLFNSDCQLTQASFTPSLGNVNLFNLKAHIPNATQCFLKNEGLSGVAFVITSPVAGKTQRIQWIATSRDGKGLSFRADR